MGKYQRSLKNIYKQYGNNIKAWESKEEGQSVPNHVVDFYKKYDLDMNARKPFISIRHWRWGNCSPEERRIDTFTKLEEIALNE